MCEPGNGEPSAVGVEPAGWAVGEGIVFEVADGGLAHGVVAVVFVFVTDRAGVARGVPSSLRHRRSEARWFSWTAPATSAYKWMLEVHGRRSTAPMLFGARKIVAKGKGMLRKPLDKEGTMSKHTFDDK